ncbi:hypothetical protein GPECTOR_43g887 [Gonium pectorale]|uniref:Uncharacterized protein n=1 Tax=Gonium pectorale TaxID=33097 RepID=A0A150G9E5_GONPE|nr:hypothetical protein GPECTOR_43g887 [Gonium pectorale]|eukprot:KXZ46451.1 hypothetical protein GPECTOR_43g887 [Gonium pectorale]
MSREHPQPAGLLPGSFDAWLSSADSGGRVDRFRQRLGLLGPGLAHAESFDSYDLSPRSDDCAPPPEGDGLSSAYSRSSLGGSSTATMTTVASCAFSSVTDSGDDLCGLSIACADSLSSPRTAPPAATTQIPPSPLNPAVPATHRISRRAFDCLPDEDDAWLGFDTVGAAAAASPAAATSCAAGLSSSHHVAIIPTCPSEPPPSSSISSRGPVLQLCRPCSPEPSAPRDARGYVLHDPRDDNRLSGGCAPTHLGRARGLSISLDVAPSPGPCADYVLDAASFWLYPACMVSRRLVSCDPWLISDRGLTVGTAAGASPALLSPAPVRAAPNPLTAFFDCMEDGDGGDDGQPLARVGPRSTSTGMLQPHTSAEDDDDDDASAEAASVAAGGSASPFARAAYLPWGASGRGLLRATAPAPAAKTTTTTTTKITTAASASPPAVTVPLEAEAAVGVPAANARSAATDASRSLLDEAVHGGRQVGFFAKKLVKALNLRRKAGTT